MRAIGEFNSKEESVRGKLFVVSHVSSNCQIIRIIKNLLGSNVVEILCKIKNFVSISIKRIQIQRERYEFKRIIINWKNNR